MHLPRSWMYTHNYYYCCYYCENVCCKVRLELFFVETLLASPVATVTVLMHFTPATVLAVAAAAAAAAVNVEECETLRWTASGFPYIKRWLQPLLLLLLPPLTGDGVTSQLPEMQLVMAPFSASLRRSRWSSRRRTSRLRKRRAQSSSRLNWMSWWRWRLAATCLFFCQRLISNVRMASVDDVINLCRRSTQTL